MRSIEILDAVQLSRIDTALAAFNALPTAERERKQYLLDALQREKAELIRYHSRARRQDKMAA